MAGDETLAGLTHVDAAGHARMVDVTAKAVTTREAVASARVRVSAAVRAAIAEGTVAKGDVLAVARVAGILAAKRTPDLVPLCHPLPIESVGVDLRLDAEAVAIEARVKTTAKTGVEMEALTAASVAALTVYDMCKALDRAMVIEAVRLESKCGGRSGTWSRPADAGEEP